MRAGACLGWMLVFAMGVAGCGERDIFQPTAGVPAARVAEGSEQYMGPHAVGHSTIRFVHSGREGEPRPVDVHLWYPATPGISAAAPPTVYRSRLFGVDVSRAC